MTLSGRCRNDRHSSPELKQDFPPVVYDYDMILSYLIRGTITLVVLVIVEVTVRKNSGNVSFVH